VESKDEDKVEGVIPGEQKMQKIQETLRRPGNQLMWGRGDVKKILP
jgi:hypothetical protein